MNLKDAFAQLTTTSPDWHNQSALTARDAKLLTDSFNKTGEGEQQIRRILIEAGYLMSESWSRHKGPEQQTGAPKQGIVTGDPKAV
jgi:hypothetical protein